MKKTTHAVMPQLMNICGASNKYLNPILSSHYLRWSVRRSVELIWRRAGSAGHRRRWAVDWSTESPVRQSSGGMACGSCNGVSLIMAGNWEQWIWWLKEQRGLTDPFLSHTILIHETQGQNINHFTDALLRNSANITTTTAQVFTWTKHWSGIYLPSYISICLRIIKYIIS